MRSEQRSVKSVGGTYQRGMMRIATILIVCHLSPITSWAQTEPEYRMEIGAGIGAVTYLGDFNGNIFHKMQPMGSLVAKYRMNPRMALAMNVSYGQLKGASRNAESYYPGLADYSFKSSLTDVGLRYEYNFWPYGTGKEYRGAKRLTPYIYIGIGVTVAKPNTTEVAMNMHFTSSDELDGIKDPYGIKSSGVFKNTDCYSHLRLSLTYDLWAKCKVCHNDYD